jgi:hypothetical protein
MRRPDKVPLDPFYSKSPPRGSMGRPVPMPVSPHVARLLSANERQQHRLAIHNSSSQSTNIDCVFSRQEARSILWKYCSVPLDSKRRETWVRWELGHQPRHQRRHQRRDPTDPSFTGCHGGYIPVLLCRSRGSKYSISKATHR